MDRATLLALATAFAWGLGCSGAGSPNLGTTASSSDGAATTPGFDGGASEDAGAPVDASSPPTTDGSLTPGGDAAPAPADDATAPPPPADDAAPAPPPADAGTTPPPSDAGPSPPPPSTTTCGNPPLVSWLMMLASSDGAAVPTTFHSAFCPAMAQDISTTTSAPVSMQQDAILSFTITPDVPGYLSSATPWIRATGSFKLPLEVIASSSPLAAGVDASHGLVYVSTRTVPAFGAPCGSMDGIVYSVPAAPGARVTYVIAGAPTPTATSTDASGVAIVLVPTSAPIDVQVVGTKSGCTILDDETGSPNVPVTPNATSNAYEAMNPM